MSATDTDRLTWTAYTPAGFELVLVGRIARAEVSVHVEEVYRDGQRLTDRSFADLFDGGHGERDAENACDDWIAGQEFAMALGLEVA